MRRRNVRVKVIQALYQRDFHKEDQPEDSEDWLHEFDARDHAFYEQLYTGVVQNQEALDQLIRQALKGWTLERLSMVDRAIIRLGAFELCYETDIPANVTLNEAVELAKQFSGDESARYVNGVLSQIKQRAENQTDGKMRP